MTGLSQTKRDGSIALVTGAAGGIGQSVAQELAAQGHRLLLVDINAAGLKELQQRYPDALTRTIDLINPDELEALCQELESLDSQLAYAFINAGMVTPGAVTDLDRATLVKDVDINLRSAMMLNHACARKMKTQSKGHIINTVSMAGVVALKGSAAYSASKFGLRGFLIALKSELIEFGVDMSMLHPSAIDTPMLRHEAVNGGSPLNFISTPLKVDDVRKVFLKAQKDKKLEYYIPYSDSLSGRLVCLFPWLIDRLYPALEKIGERGRQSFIESKGI